MTTPRPVVVRSSWPPMVRNGGHQRSGFMAASGQILVALDRATSRVVDRDSAYAAIREAYLELNESGQLDLSPSLMEQPT